MKKTLLTLSIAACASLVPLAGQAQTSAPSASTQPDAQAFDKQLAEVQANMKLMQEQMLRIRQTQDPEERQKLLQEHWATMQSSMTAMHGMWGPGMMGCCGGPGHGMMGGPGMMKGGPGMMGGPGMRHYYGKLTPDQLKQRQYMTDQYIGMQQMMMDHMMQHQQWMFPQPPSAPGK